MTPAYADVIGNPIEQSKSPVIHGFWLDRLGMDGAYHRSRVSREALGSFVAERRRDPHWRGCNVTMPLKLDALLLADRRSDAAVQAGACNLLLPRDGELVADNTDIDAIALVVKRLATGRQTRTVTLLGTGGAARAVLVALTGMGIRSVAIQARNRDEALSLASMFDLSLPPQPFGKPVQTDGLLNATPLGMTDHSTLKIDLSAMPHHGWVFDLVSSPAQTSLVTQARGKGLAAEGGLAMLVEQAAASFPALFGAEPPRSPDDDEALNRRLLA